MKHSNHKYIQAFRAVIVVTTFALITFTFGGCDQLLDDAAQNLVSSPLNTIGMNKLATSSFTVTFALHGGTLTGGSTDNTLILKAGQSLKDVGITSKLTYSVVNGITRTLERFEHNKQKHDENTAITSDISLSVIWKNSCGATETQHPQNKVALQALLNKAITSATPSPNLNHIDTSAITNMNRLFQGESKFNGDIKCWNTSQVTDMVGMFWGAGVFTQDIGQWNTSQVRDMSYMFSKAIAFNEDISNWDTSQVKNMEDMFYSATSFNQDIGQWNTSQVRDMSYMFSKAIAFNEDISNWDTSQVKNMEDMFYSATSFNQGIGSWDTSKVTNMAWMFARATAFNQDLSGWKVDSVTRWDNIFNSVTKMNKDKSKWPKFK